jgi:protein-S-isoprenylcysteine O-methyltransferase Ste14
MATQTRQQYSRGRFLVSCVITALLFPAFLLLLGGHWRWIEGWIFGLWCDVMILGNMIYLYLKDPALLAERSKAPGSDNQKTWDKYLLSLIYVVALAWFAILPLDASRFKWSPEFPLSLKALGGLMLVPALYFIQWATMENTYLSTLVRIQDDRHQRVISTGVYSVVRHPLYLGCLLMAFGASLLVGSVIGLIVSVMMLFAIAVRITGEEAMLVHELQGYDEYEKRVTSRLIPFIW